MCGIFEPKRIGSQANAWVAFGGVGGVGDWCEASGGVVLAAMNRDLILPRGALRACGAALALCSVLGCSKSDTTPSAPPPSNSGNLTATERPPTDPPGFERLGNAVAACHMQTGTNYGIDPKCPQVKAYEAAREALPGAQKYGIDAAVAPKFLTSPDAPVRALGATYLSSFFNAPLASTEKIADAMAKESDPAVLAHMVRMAGSVAEKSEKIAAAIVAAAGHADKGVRFQAAAILENAKIAGGTAKILELAEKDPDQEVRDLACANLGHHGDCALALLEKQTASSTTPGYSACFVGLVKQWANYPLFDTGSEKAYKLTLQRLTQKPHGDKAPAFTALTLIGHLGEDVVETTTWKKEHPWFNANAVVKALGDVVTDPATGYAPRMGAVDAAVKLGASKKDLEAWRKTFGAKPDESTASITKKLDDEIAKK